MTMTNDGDDEVKYDDNDIHNDNNGNDDDSECREEAAAAPQGCWGRSPLQCPSPPPPLKDIFTRTPLAKSRSRH